jgi:hypothetical protein
MQHETLTPQATADYREAICQVEEEIVMLDEATMLKPDYRTSLAGWHFWYDLRRRRAEASAARDQLRRQLDQPGGAP